MGFSGFAHGPKPELWWHLKAVIRILQAIVLAKTDCGDFLLLF
jgi:hypothetical protein